MLIRTGTGTETVRFLKLETTTKPVSD